MKKTFHVHDTFIVTPTSTPGCPRDAALFALKASAASSCHDDIRESLTLSDGVYTCKYIYARGAERFSCKWSAKVKAMPSGDFRVYVGRVSHTER